MLIFKVLGFFLNVGWLNVGGVVLDTKLVSSVIFNVFCRLPHSYKNCGHELEASELWVLGAGDRPGRGNSPYPLGCQALKHRAKKSLICLVASVFKMKTSFKIRSSAVTVWRLLLSVIHNWKCNLETLTQALSHCPQLHPQFLHFCAEGGKSNTYLIPFLHILGLYSRQYKVPYMHVPFS